MHTQLQSVINRAEYCNTALISLPLDPANLHAAHQLAGGGDPNVCPRSSMHSVPNESSTSTHATYPMPQSHAPSAAHTTSNPAPQHAPS
eukprot:CAMPEP_0171100294 /NCGR_PEP_ID=MMETSP0766_2-20121228/52877_1 /TAXON_ID=439317 /ORGANISM="Gambierdiscus australes, Strain CAWD 149" /LENGTH=88 /DNA_ID=CAMNT_0011560103 /DNA_START=546 /DNA_END=812 /DNA_ORIENTATION=+